MVAIGTSLIQLMARLMLSARADMRQWKSVFCKPIKGVCRKLFVRVASENVPSIPARVRYFSRNSDVLCRNLLAANISCHWRGYNFKLRACALVQRSLNEQA